MKQEVLDIIQKLKNGAIASTGKAQTFAVTITDAVGFKPICNSKTGEAMAQEKGTVEDYFNWLSQNYSTVAIQLRRRNGNSWKDDGAPITITFKPNQAEPITQATPMPSYNPPANNYPAPQNPFSGLMGGLNMDVAYRYQDYPEVKAERDRLRTEVERLKDELSERKIEAIKNEFSETKASGNKEMINSLVTALAPLAASMMAKGAAAPEGLNAAVSTEGLGEYKQALITAITQQSETIAQNLYSVLHGMLNNQEFANELFTLIQKHQANTHGTE
ncbi:hypothetical protein [Flavobacterium alkalisoli]|uniref:hypothetical protein n=1 Tax=Flavobacterium alkalisoli TaxID=2602769 RepID=UPI003A90ACAD